YLDSAINSVIDCYIKIPFDGLELNSLLKNIIESIILAIKSGLGIAFPYVFLFYLFISAIEDTGYLTRAAFLADQCMHKIGLHGQSVIPIVLSFGCSVPAIMSTRLLKTERERIISSILVTMLPCSARTIVIASIVATFIGWGAALSIYVIILILVFLVGYVLSKSLSGEQYGMILEMSKLRTPSISSIISKTWLKVREFIYIAMPLLVISSILMGLCKYCGLIDWFKDYIDPISLAVLGLPGFALTALLFGILRKEMALSVLITLAGTDNLTLVLDSVQLYVFAMLCTIFIPCISTIAVLIRAIGVKYTIISTLFTFCIGIGMGSLLYHLLQLI
ncbi:MAG TPA: ferrous iron transport protein B, partial [Methanocorpusculum sp.]|nr:ferrous iron transport protein B [Methanocorpusculum sp.]